MRITLAIIAIAMLVAAVPAGAQTKRDAAACAALTSLQIPGVALTMTKAEWVAEGSSPPAGRGGGPASTGTAASCFRVAAA